MTNPLRPIAGPVTAAALMILAAPAQAEPRVVVTIKPIHSLVARVMEGVGTPSVLVSGAASPHTYAMKPSDAKALNHADVFFRVGEAIEPFTRKVVASLPDSVHVSTLVEAPGMKLLDVREGATFEAHAHAAQGDSHDQHGDDAHREAHGHGEKSATAGEDDDREEAGSRDHHVWLDPGNAKAMAEEIARVLAKEDPEHAARYQENARRAGADIDALAAELAADLKPVLGKPFVVFHDAYQYFERRFGLDAVGSITVSPDVQPSAKRLASIRRKIKKLGAVCVFAEPVFAPKLVAAVTEGTRAHAGTLDPEGIGLAPGPDAYFQLMRGLSEGLRRCLRESS